MDLTYYAKIKYARSIAYDAGLNLKEDNGVTQPYTDGHTIYVPVYDPMWDPTGVEATIWWTFFLHEIFHHQHPDDFALANKKKISHKSFFGALWNLVVDHNIERAAWGMYPGRDKLFASGRQIINQSQCHGLAKEPVGNHSQLVGVGIWDMHLRKQWMDGAGSVDIDQVLDRHPKVKEDFDKLEASGLADEYLKVKNAKENYELVKKILEVLDYDPEEEEEKKGQEQAKQGGEGQGENDGASGEQGEGDGEKVEGQVDGQTNYDDIIFHNHDGSKGPSFTKLDINYSGYDPTKWVKYIPREVKVHDLVGRAFSGDNGYSHRLNTMSGEKALSTQVKKYLLAASRSKMESGHKRGRIDGGKLWKHVAYKYTDAGQRVMKQRVIKNTLNTAVQIIVDQSGSMGGNRFKNAAYSAVLLNEVFAKIGVPVEIFSFTDTAGRPQHYIHKHFSSKVTKADLISSFDYASYDMANNADGEALFWGANRIATRKEPKKVMIILSDGQPSSWGCHGDIYQYTKDVAKFIEEKTPIELYAIGIETNSVKRIYKNSEVINSPSQLESTLLKLLKEKVLNHV